MLGKSPAFLAALDLLRRAAPSPCTVLLTGETGTGKELAAREVHRRSRRAGRPFVAVNCASLSESLLESDLFGHERGAFTGAVERKLGKMELADGGTLFLDEVGEMLPSVQARLLRALQEREVTRVGGTRPRPVDLRVVAATNRRLRQEVEEGRFRRDLLYRLQVIRIVLPPLRERPGDVARLARHFLAEIARLQPDYPRAFSSQALAALEAHAWPGNVRELKNVVEAGAVLAEGERIETRDLPAEVRAGEAAESLSGTYREALRQTRRRLILDALRETQGNVTRAAQRLGINATYIHKLIRDLDIRPALSS